MIEDDGIVWAGMPPQAITEGDDDADGVVIDATTSDGTLIVIAHSASFALLVGQRLDIGASVEALAL